MSAPILLATWSFSRRCLEAAWPALDAGGDGMDAVETACRVAEDDGRIDSVGYGGLPDRDGGMSLDGCVMRGPRACGAVCALRRSRHPVSVARRVMERNEHLLLAGDGADAFAAAEGFEREELLAPAAAAAWSRWVASGRTQALDQGVDAALLRPIDDGDRTTDATGRLFGGERPKKSDSTAPEAPTDAESRWRHHDTIGVLALDREGRLAGGCSTSGTPFKQRGRVGDSPIIGHGLYVEPGVGASVATGSGELVMGVCGTFLAVETLRRTGDPAAAAKVTLERIAASGPLEPAHQVGLIVLAADGRWATASLRNGYRTCIATELAVEVMETEIVLFPEQIAGQSKAP